MTNPIQTIPFANLLIAGIPVVVVVVILFRWSLNASNAIYALARMLAQLLIVGYFLAYIFTSNSAAIITLILAMMVLISSWIALGTVKDQRKKLYKNAVVSIAIGGGLVMLVITQGVLQLEPWYWPQYVIPLAGMVFANAMNSVSLAAERFAAELSRDVSYHDARNIALQASLIPVINSLLAVGLVSIPGMMTGQILSGVEPPIAARYQIMVMCMIFGSAGLSSACYLWMSRNK